MTFGGQGFKVRVGVLVLHDDGEQLLLIRQNGRPFWVLPGGTLEHEPPETLEACAVRELREEANLGIQVQRLLYLGDFMAEGNKRSLDVVFLAELLPDSSPDSLHMATNENLDEIAWVHFRDLSSLQLQPEAVFHKIKKGDFSPCYIGGYFP